MFIGKTAGCHDESSAPVRNLSLPIATDVGGDSMFLPQALRRQVHFLQNHLIHSGNDLGKDAYQNICRSPDGYHGLKPEKKWAKGKYGVLI